MAKMFRQGRFNFVGELKAGKEPVTTQKLGESKWSKTRFGIGVKVEENMQYLNLEYIHEPNQTTTKILGKDGQVFEVKLSDTANSSTVDNAADFIKTIIDLETDFEKKKEYTSLIFKRRNHEMKSDNEKTDEDIEKISEYTKQIKEIADNRIELCHTKDIISFLNTSLPKFEGKRVRVTGNIKSNYYNGKNQLQYIPTMIEFVDDDIEPQLKAFLDIFYDKDSIDDDKKEKKIYVNGYIGETIKRQDKLFPVSVVIDYTKIDENDEQQRQLLDFMKDTFKITNKKEIHKIGVEINVINGRETKAFSEDYLTDKQRLSIALGLKKLEDFKPRGNVYGDRVQELKVIMPDLKAYPDGCVEVFPSSELDSYLVMDDSDIKEKDMKKDNEEKKEDTNTNSEDMFKKLFG